MVRKCGLEARGISGEKLRVNGLADLWFKIGDKIGLHSFIVVEMRDKCVIGADFLRKTGMVVDVAREKLWWDTGEADLVVQENAPVVNKVSTLVNQYRDLFVDESNDELGRTSVTEHSIDTGENCPIKQRPYRTPVHLQGEVNKQVNDMLKRGLIRPSDSPWSSPIVLAPKKDGTYRFCVDFRRVNTVTRKDAHPMPRVDDILDRLGGAQHFTTLDLASGYWQVPLHEEDK